MTDLTPITIALPGPPPLRMSAYDVGPRANTPALLAIHGVGGKKEQWREQLMYFGARYRMIAPDLRGHHQSAVTSGSYTMQRITDDLRQLLVARKVQTPVAILGHSYGGIFALDLAWKHPDLVSHVVLIGVAQHLNYSLLFKLATRAPVPGHLLEWGRIVLFRRKFNATAPIMRSIMAQALLPWTGWDHLHEITQPVLAIAGKLDIVAPPPAVARMVRRFPRAQLRVVLNVKHKIHLQRPDTTNRIIETFLAADQARG